MDGAPTTSATLTPDTSPWHAGEVALQRTAGMAERMDSIGRKVIRSFMPDQHREFFGQLPFVVMGAVDPEGRVWATLRGDHPGFLHAPSPQRLSVALPREPQDPADAGMEEGDAVGLLGIELHTRRRNRMNGRVRRAESGFEIEVRQSFGNCPQYIQLRQFEYSQQEAGAPLVLGALDADARALIVAADSFYVATYADLPDGERQVDASHRGGRPGFVRLEDDGSLTVPDYMGNMFFNTLGNIVLNGKAGLVFVDFATGSLLQMSGYATLLPDAEGSAALASFDGAERLWRFTPQRIVRRPAALPLRWTTLSSRPGLRPVQ